jgi:two-component system OmpR family sensor kinase
MVLESCLEEIDRLGRLSDTLILLARLDSGEMRPQREQVDVAELVRERVQAARARWNDHDFAVGEGKQSVIASVDTGMVQSVIDQLLENVEQHTPVGTHSTVAVVENDTQVTVTVSDDGPGLDEASLAQLFDRFYRADEARTRSSNVGLGLAVIAAIAQAHGGRASAAKSPAGGLQVQVTLPSGNGGPKA